MLEADPGDAFLLYALAQELAKASDFSGAVELYDRCLAADPNYLYAYFHKAMALRDRDAPGDLALAAVTLRTGVDRARAAKDTKALSELSGLLDQIE